MSRLSSSLRRWTLFSLAVASSFCCFGAAQVEAQQKVVKPNYAQAKQYSSRYLRQFVYSSSVRPVWIGKSDTFWYSYKTAKGRTYYLVDAKRANKDPLFDHEKLAGQLSAATRRPVDGHNLNLSGMRVADDGKSMTFRAGSSSYKYDFDSEKLEKVVRKPVAKKPEAKPATTKSGKDTKKKTDKKDVSKKTDKSSKTKTDSKDKTKSTGKSKSDDKSKSDKKDQKKTSDSKKSDSKKVDKKSTQKKDDKKKDVKKKTTQKKSTSSTAKKPTRTRRQSEYRSFSPDRKSYVFAKGHDLYWVKIPKNYKPPGSKKPTTKKKAASKSTEADKSKKTDKKSDDKKKSEKKEQSKEKTDKKDQDKKSDDKKTEKPKTLPIPKMDPKLDAKAIRLTKDGVEDFSYAGSSRSFFSRGRSRSTTNTKTDPNKKTRPGVVWSSDSKSFYINRYDRRNVKKLFVINSLSNPRPTLEQYSYPMPGEEGIRVQHLYYFNAAQKKLLRVEPKWKHETYRNLHWNRSGDKLRFGRHDRLLRNVEFCELDIPSGKTNCMISDGFEAAFYESRSARYLKNSDEMIWWSEKSGWGHYYLYDRDGKFKNAITSGPFRASRIVDIDEKNRLMYFYANGREKNENIYYQHLYRVRLDGTGLTLLDPGNANHRSSLSPSKKFVIDNFSAVDKAPTAILRDALGNKIMDLETSDLSRLKEVGWRMPETFVVKAADGVTNLYGNMWKPFDFNPKKKYPIIAHVYPGPQTEGTSHTFSATAGNQQLAQLGFIVIQVGHRGGTPQRSKAYASYGYFNMRDYGLADKKSAIEQLGQRFSFIDVKRVGIYGHSGGGFMTATALLLPPYNDFFTAGFSTAGNHDNNIYNNSWSERYHGLKLVKGKAAEKKTTSTSSTSTRSNLTEEQRRRMEEFLRRRRRGAPDSSFDYAAGDVSEGDYFYEHEGQIDPLADGPEAFLNPQKKEQKKKDTTKEKDQKKTTTKSTTKKTVTKKKDESRFEIKIPTTVELAENLKGHLFLVHGEADNNVHPANTLRLVDALIKKNKRFDMLYLPATRHGFGRYQPYVTQRMYEFFAEHLMDDYQDDADLSDRK